MAEKYVAKSKLDSALEGLCKKYNVSYGEESMGFGRELAELSDQLAAYEDTGLAPEEIAALVADNKRLHALVDVAEEILKRRVGNDEIKNTKEKRERKSVDGFDGNC